MTEQAGSQDKSEAGGPYREAPDETPESLEALRAQLRKDKGEPPEMSIEGVDGNFQPADQEPDLNALRDLIKDSQKK